jgi:hypothetical protein
MGQQLFNRQQRLFVRIFVLEFLVNVWLIIILSNINRFGRTVRLQYKNTRTVVV